jgi:hypothetical protein
MAYGTDISVYVEDRAGDVGAPGSPAPWWLSPDIDILTHPGEAVQGVNQVQIRVHAHDEPILDEKITAEVYVGNPSLVMSPTAGTKRIDTPGSLMFRPVGLAGTEPVADVAGGLAAFSWTPSSSASAVDGPGHRCLVVRAFPLSVTPPSSPFDVPNEAHEAQHNIEVLATTNEKGNMRRGGAGTKNDPRKRDRQTGLWWERFDTLAAGKRGKRFVVWAFDPAPDKGIVDVLRGAVGKGARTTISKDPPSQVALEAVGTRGEEVDPRRLLKNRRFARSAGLGEGLFAEDRLLGAASLVLGPRKLCSLLLRFDHSNLKPRSAVVLHGAQWDEAGRAEGGITVVALAPV